MPGEPDNIVLQYLPRIDQKVDQLIHDGRDLKGIGRRPDIIDAPPGVRE